MFRLCFPVRMLLSVTLYRTSENPFTPVLKYLGTGARARIRTGGLPLRRRLLYPAELHAHIIYSVF